MIALGGGSVLSERVHVEYKCTDFYDREDVFGLAWNDPEIGIDWPVPEPTLSARDRSGMSLRDYAQKPAFRYRGGR